MQQNDLKTKLLCIIIIVYSDGYTRLDIVGVCVCVSWFFIYFFFLFHLLLSIGGQVPQENEVGRRHFECEGHGGGTCSPLQHAIIINQKSEINDQNWQLLAREGNVRNENLVKQIKAFFFLFSNTTPHCSCRNCRWAEASSYFLLLLWRWRGNS